MKIELSKEFSPKPGVVFSTNRKYEVRDQNLRSVNAFHRSDDWYNIPNEYIIGTTENARMQVEDESKMDCWTLIVDRTGIDRQKVKRFFFKYWHEVPIPTICKEDKIRCQDVAHMIAVFNEWADAQDPGDK